MPGTRALVKDQVARLGVGEGHRLAGVVLRVGVARNRDSVRAVDGPRQAGAATADVFLLTSINEGIPLTVIEAMAAGLPVVATDVSGVAEVVRNGETGLLAPSGDVESLARHVLRLTASEERERMGRAGRERAFSLFSEDEMVAAYDRLYREMLHA